MHDILVVREFFGVHVFVIIIVALLNELLGVDGLTHQLLRSTQLDAVIHWHIRAKDELSIVLLVVVVQQIFILGIQRAFVSIR